MKTCPRCHGTGLRPDRDRVPPRECNLCNGKGELQEETCNHACPTCGDGFGFVFSKPLTFRELAVGDMFIGFPNDGDDNGHGGFRRGSYLFQKIQLLEGIEGVPKDNSRSVFRGTYSHTPDSKLVLRIL